MYLQIVQGLSKCCREIYEALQYIHTNLLRRRQEHILQFSETLHQIWNSSWEQSCWTRTQNNSTGRSPSLCEIWKASLRTSTSFNSPKKGSPRPRSPRHPLAENEYAITGHWIAGQNTEHRTLVLWRRWLQALGLFYKKNMPDNNTAYPICKTNLSFNSFLWEEQWSCGADVESRNTHMHSLSAQLHNWWW
jgi:hypothetical protein